MSVKLLAEQHLEFLSLKGGFRGLSESTHVRMPHCWKSHVAAQLSLYIYIIYFGPCLEIYFENKCAITSAIKGTCLLGLSVSCR